MLQKPTIAVSTLPELSTKLRSRYRVFFFNWDHPLKFNQVQKRSEDERPWSLLQDVTTRWNSQLLCMRSCLKSEGAIRAVLGSEEFKSMKSLVSDLLHWHNNKMICIREGWSLANRKLICWGDYAVFWSLFMMPQISSLMMPAVLVRCLHFW